MHQYDLRLLQRRVRTARAHGHAHIGHRQTWRVVHAVTDHRHKFPLPREALDGLHFFLGLQFRPHLIHGQLLAEMLARFAPVAGQHHAAQTERTQFLHHAARLRPQVVPQQHPAQQILEDKPDLGHAFLRLGNGGKNHRVAEVGYDLGDPIAFAQAHAVPFHHRLQARAGNGFQIGNLDQRDALLLAVARDGAGQRMRGEAFERIGQLRHLALAPRRKTLHALHLKLARGQRAGLVHRHHVHLREIFHRRAAAKENAAPRAARDGRQHRRGNRQHQRAGRRHDQQRHRLVKRALACARGNKRRTSRRQPPDEKHHRRQRENAPGVGGAELVGESLRRRLEMLRLLDQLDDLLQRTFPGGPQHDRLDHAGEIHRPGQQRVTDLLLHRHRFAGEIRFIGRRAAFQHLGIDGELLIGFDQQALAGAQLLHGRGDFMALLVEHKRGLGRVLEQRTNLAARPAHRVMLQRAGEREEKQQHRAFAPRADGRAARRDREHEEMHVEMALLQSFPNFLRGEPRAGQIRYDVAGQRGVARTEKKSRQSERATERRRRELPLPFVLVVFLVRQVDFARDELRQREPPPFPKLWRGRAGQPFDGGLAVLMPNFEMLHRVRRIGRGAAFAVRLSRQQTAARLLAGLLLQMDDAI